MNVRTCEPILGPSNRVCQQQFVAGYHGSSTMHRTRNQSASLACELNYSSSLYMNKNLCIMKCSTIINDFMTYSNTLTLYTFIKFLINIKFLIHKTCIPKHVFSRKLTTQIMNRLYCTVLYILLYEYTRVL